MYVPVIRKMVYSDSTMIERSLPAEGNIHVRVGDTVRAFDHIGECTISHKSLVLPDGFSPSIKNITTSKKFAYSGAQIGSIGNKKITAPYNGFLSRKDKTKTYIFEEEPHAYLLLSGVWGQVEKVVEKKSVLLKAQTRNIHMMAATAGSYVGELIVLPNKSDALDNYFSKMVANRAWGKILYVGDYIDMESLVKIKEAGVKAILAGSARREVISYAKNNNLFFGLVSGFGEVKTPPEIHTFLSAVSDRLVFLHGVDHLLVVPLSPEDTSAMKSESTQKTKDKTFMTIKKGMKVIVYQGAYFGYIGKVTNLRKNSIMVKIDGVTDSVEVYIPNLFILE